MAFYPTRGMEGGLNPVGLPYIPTPRVYHKRCVIPTTLFNWRAPKNFEFPPGLPGGKIKIVMVEKKG